MGDEPFQGQHLQARNDPDQVQQTSPSHPSQPAQIQQPPRQPSMEFEAYPSQQQYAMQHQGTAVYDMSGMARALPDYQMRQFVPQPYQQQYTTPSAQSNPPVMYQYQQGAQFAGQTGGGYNQNYVQHYLPQFAPNQHLRQPQGPYPHMMPGVSGPNSNFVMQHHSHNLLQPPTGGQYGQAYTSRQGVYASPQIRQDLNIHTGTTHPLYQQIHPPVRRSSSSSSLQASVLRGPPRKPKQSGHALWVGNLPPGTQIIDLKDHFSRDATTDIESVFLISKSNCAFVNYKSESSCAAAMTRFHDSRFQGVRLVCRLRRGSSPAQGATNPTTPGGLSPGDTETAEEITGEGISGDEQTQQPEDLIEETSVTKPTESEKAKEKFFVVKSLTVEDLERSVSSGIWATQAHNEEALNKAYKMAENVYLIFSANKSGEYFGYARMESAIDDEAAATIEYPTRIEIPEPSPADLPLTIPTAPTATAPRGRIIDDSARGTIFWEAFEEEDDHNKDEDTGNISGEGEDVAASGGASPATPQTFGKPFKIVWMSTERLPFYRTRGLRNPWNANREVKIARDGTEIEPTVGRRLVNMFHRPLVQTTTPVANRQPTMSPMPRGPGGYPGPQPTMPGNMYGRSY